MSTYALFIPEENQEDVDFDQDALIAPSLQFEGDSEPLYWKDYEKNVNGAVQLLVHVNETGQRSVQVRALIYDENEESENRETGQKGPILQHQSSNGKSFSELTENSEAVKAISANIVLPASIFRNIHNDPLSEFADSFAEIGYDQSSRQSSTSSGESLKNIIVDLYRGDCSSYSRVNEMFEYVQAVMFAFISPLVMVGLGGCLLVVLVFVGIDLSKKASSRRTNDERLDEKFDEKKILALV